ncbi:MULTISPECIES: DUF3558 domain-containing protein [unclassified Streptomyces]|jgi:hypothetical protein|uniref:DUF3558 domain-containing protein n=1 Tax=unclassified Streptomyces TaxID=2593676 RepID=UPI000884897C|nr:MULTISPECIES: DUF3558 domain-containing protein [unclassified Streptomyces]MDX2728832.1 DUF3558 domain-containing protein [Streptomyces sp. PA03-2a]MDX3766565.1 DUF3558 domain-containing protein [Streptomyces sp. AK08-01B]MDX3816178.1 DUF3558 domain-containing protein [Streptomyces sp. AK08-01A]SCZ03018.1 hypothetical protein SAMN02745898_10729 [Streptomyces sp. 136MFCol5.1]SFT31700.1 hypothetical protein SAMN04487982_12239 [Streptomyces sp. ok210]
MAYVPGAALLAALVVGCSAGTGTDGSAADSRPGGPTSSPAAPAGKYRTLPDPCRSVTHSTLKDLLPGVAELPQEQQEKAYAGTASVTYDTDRRVGCTWKAEDSDSSRGLSLDFERVVSYDTSVSDDDRADEVYGKKEAAAHLPSSASDTPSDSSSPSGSAPSDGETGGKSGDGATEDLQPRVLDNLGDAAFLDDLLIKAGSAAQHRTVSVVFRTSNVIVTVRYTEQPALSTEMPDSKELQEKAQALARKLVDKFSE